jgi:single-strand selective monofunctional uracil DNA glycosylase
VKTLDSLRFDPPVSYVYNPLVYARKAHERYLTLYGGGTRKVLLLGMNPGPWGMAQTGIPFGDVVSVRDWLKIRVPVGSPQRAHPKRPVLGLECPRREVSGKRLWGWAEKTFGTPKRFFSRFLVVNYCPLLFLEETGRNRTPDKLKAAERDALFSACDQALIRTVEVLKPRYVVGIGNFAEGRARQALSEHGVTIGRITHPSPANPRANRDWEGYVQKDFASMGIRF